MSQTCVRKDPDEFRKITSSLSDETSSNTISGDSWYGSVPANWELLKISQCFSLRSEKVDQSDFRALSVTKSGIIPQLEHVAKSSDSGNRSLVKINDFVINSRSDRKGSCGISQYEGSVSSVNTVIIPNQDIIFPSYVNGLLRTKEFQEEFYRFGKGIVDDLWTTSWTEMRDIVIPIPPLEEQKRIASKLEKLNKLKENLVDLSDKFSPFENSLKSSIVFGNRYETN